MFSKSKINQQIDLFSYNNHVLRGQVLAIYENDNEWHNIFYNTVTKKVDETIFKPLFREDFGAPNSSIRVLFAMMVLKSAFNWSTNQLYSNCQFNIQVRGALGLFNLSDPVPVEATYYNFKKRIVEHEKQGNPNLFELAFAQITQSQIAEYCIDGNKVRMDSKLLGSNIAWLSRYENVHETLRLAYASAPDSFAKLLSKDDLSIINALSLEKCSSVSHRNNDTQLADRMKKLGVIIYKFLLLFKGESTEAIEVLRSVFQQQYEVSDDLVIVLSKEKQHFDIIETPHDPDARFHKKGDDKNTGYSVNITETCNSDNPVNLITNVIVEPATTADNTFLIPAIEETEKITNTKIETVNADGAYHSQNNQSYCQDNSIDLIISGICGRIPRFVYSLDENNELICWDTQTETYLHTEKILSKKEKTILSWRFYVPDSNKIKHVTEKDLANSLLRQKIANRTLQERYIRNNVEATIFQLGYHYRANKTQYRGLIGHRIWANCRCLWINFRRIMKYRVLNEPESSNIVSASFSFLKYAFFALNVP